MTDNLNPQDFSTFSDELEAELRLAHRICWGYEGDLNDAWHEVERVKAKLRRVRVSRSWYLAATFGIGWVLAWWLV